MKRLLLFVLLVCCAVVVSMAQSVEVVESFREVQSSSIVALYKTEFREEIVEYSNGDKFDFVVIRVLLEGDVAEAKKQVTLRCPTQNLVRTYKEISNQMLFLFPYEAKTIFVDCGDGCESKPLISGKQLRSNIVYETTVKYTARKEQENKTNNRVVSLKYNPGAGEVVSYRERLDVPVDFFQLSANSVELEIGKCYEFKFSIINSPFKDSIALYQISNNVNVIEFPKLTSFKRKISKSLSETHIESNDSKNMYVKDCQGHTYPVVKIGSQYWMAENLQCTKYDTDSERAGQMLQTSSSRTYAPYYTDGRYANTEYSGNLTNEQRKHLGLLYNWAAAMGYTESQAKSQIGSYSGRRQGICPNGWHLPNLSEWNTLAEYCGGKSNAGGKLKSRSGWYNGGNGTDDYGFSGLPAGFAGGSIVTVVGEWGLFWSSDAKSSDYAYIRDLVCNNSYLGEYYIDKDYARSVRCLRD